MMKLSNLPPIPNKRYFTIGEVSHLCSVKPHVLRYWEQEFRQLKPIKRSGTNRRYYQRDHIVLVREIMSLLYEQKFTINGARNRLNAIKGNSSHPSPSLFIRKAINDLENVLNLLKTESMVK